MNRLRIIAGVVIGLILFAVVTVRAAAPSVIMICGGSLQKPVFIEPSMIASQISCGFLYGGSTTGIDKNLGARQFLAVAMFWCGTSGIV